MYRVEKVKITRKQADLLDDLLPNTDINWILSQLVDWHSVLKSTKEMAELHYLYVNDPLTFSKALVIGYEVEETPEDKVKSLHKTREIEANSKPFGSDDKPYYDGICRGIKECLEALNIKIEGIN